MPKGIPNSAAMYGIFTRPWGYEVSVMRNGTRHYRQFGRASYGGAEQALAHAQDWRDAIVRQHPPIARRARAEQPRANNSTGAPGVYSRVAPDGRVRAWLAKTYIAEDQILQTYFSVDGADRAAHAAALAERARQLAQMTGLAHVHPAEEAIRRETDAAPRARTARLSRAEIVRRNNSSGTSGVQFKSPRPDHPGLLDGDHLHRRARHRQQGLLGEDPWRAGGQAARDRRARDAARAQAAARRRGAGVLMAARACRAGPAGTAGAVLP